MIDEQLVALVVDLCFCFRTAAPRGSTELRTRAASFGSAAQGQCFGLAFPTSRVIVACFPRLFCHHRRAAQALLPPAAARTAANAERTYELTPYPYSLLQPWILHTAVQVKQNSQALKLEAFREFLVAL